MIDAPIQQPKALPEKILEAIETFEHDEFEYFLMNDPELDVAYAACLKAAGIEWTDEQVAEAAFRRQYGDCIDDLMQTWRFRQSIRVGDSKAVAVHIAVTKFMRRQKQGHARV